MQVIAYYDYLLLLPYSMLFYFLVKKYLKKVSTTSTEYKWLMIGWFIKMIACILYAWMIVYYYGYGDPMGYYKFATQLRGSIIADFSNVKFLFQGGDAFKNYLASFTSNINDLNYLDYYNSANFMIHKISCVISFFTFNRFLIISLVFTNFSYLGFVIIYNSLKKIIGNYQKQLLIGCLFIPSCIFWSSGLAKEPICILCIAILFSQVIKMFIFGKYNVYSIISTLLYGYILYVVKVYLFICLFAAFVCWYGYKHVKASISKTPFLKFVYLLLSVIVIVCIVFMWGSTISNLITSHAGSILEYNSNVYSIIAENQGGGSLINISDIDVSSLSGILKFLPRGLVNVFFRPWPWEISNVLMIFTVLENLFFLYLFIKVVFKSRFFTRILFIGNDFQVFAIVFSILLALIIGISTFNFGTMVRYKIPFLPFWACFLLVINNKIIVKNPKKV